MSKYFYLIPFFIFAIFNMGANAKKKVWSLDDNIYEALHNLGDVQPLHHNYNPDLVKKGKEIVYEGRTHDDQGKLSKYVSKYYMCTTCHNQVQEDPDLKESNPDTRLPYVKEKGIPFLQGTTFKGIINRETWYNDDYINKYGEEKIKKAHNNLRESIQLCAVECSQGRAMKTWELEAVLAYMWTLQFTFQDLGFSTDDFSIINSNEVSNTEKIKLIKSYYLQKSPAHFYNAPPSKFDGYEGLVGNPETGADIYKSSCLSCHNPNGVSHYILKENKHSYQHIKKKLFKNSHFSLYQIIPYGTYAIPGHRPYMPHYPLERMSKQQVEDLRAFIESKVKK